MISHKRNCELQKRAARRLVKMALEAGFVVSHHDGEAYTVKRSRDYRAICAELWATDEERLICRHLGGQLAGIAYIVWGNSAPELVADHTLDGGPFEALMGRFYNYAQSLED